MKKVIAGLMAGAMLVTMAVPAFAAPAQDNIVYNGDGEKNGDVYDSNYARAVGLNDISIDGVVPNAVLYIPLGADMDAGENADLKAAGTKFVKELAAAAGADLKATVSGTDKYYEYVDFQDAEGYFLSGAITSGTPDTATAYASAMPTAISLDSLTNDDYFKFDVDKDENGKMIKKISVVSDKKLGSIGRTAYLKIELNDSTTTSDIKSDGTISFKAKNDSASYVTASGSKKLTRKDFWKSGDEFKINYTFWINNIKTKNDDNPDNGDRIYFDPDDNEDNTLVWGDDRAALYFEANDDASKFYARLSTKSDSDIYTEYGDPQNADLWFYDFVGSSNIPATARATLTLGIPWDEDDDYVPNPEDCFIYKNEDGVLTDVTDQFTYSEDNDGTTEIEGWSTKVRALGSYVISDTELDLAAIDVDDIEPTDEPSEEPTSSTVSGGKDIPNTGSSDMVGVATVAAIVSLAAAGAVAFKKASK